MLHGGCLCIASLILSLTLCLGNRLESLCIALGAIALCHVGNEIPTDSGEESERLQKLPVRPTAAWREHGENRNIRLQQQSYRFTHKHSFFSQSGSYGRSQAIATRFYCDSWKQTLGETSEDSGSKEKHCRSPWTKIKRRTRTHLGVHGKPGLSLPLSNASLEPRLFHRSGKPHQKRKKLFHTEFAQDSSFPATPATAGSWPAGCLCWL